MKAFGYRNPSAIDHPDALIALDVPLSPLRPRDLLVRVRAVSVNPVDVKLRAAAAPPAGQARILGSDAPGVVEARGDRVPLSRPGDGVFSAGPPARPGSTAEPPLVD